MGSRSLLVLCCGLLAFGTVLAGTLVKYRMPDGQVGFTDSPRLVPPGAQVLNSAGVAPTFDERFQEYSGYVRRGELDDAKAMLDRKFVLSQDAEGFTVLLISLRDTDLVNDIMTLGADVHHANAAGDTALHIAARSAKRRALTTLLTWNADPNTVNHSGETALVAAIQADRFDNADYLVSKGADPNVMDKTGGSALLYAVAKDEFTLVKYLLKKGARLDGYPEAHSPMSVAQASGNSAIAKLLSAQSVATESVAEQP